MRVMAERPFPASLSWHIAMRRKSREGLTGLAAAPRSSHDWTSRDWRSRGLCMLLVNMLRCVVP